jgi:hypothetical protein
VNNKREDAASTKADYLEDYGRKSGRLAGVRIPGEVRRGRCRNNSNASVKVESEVS